MEPLPARAADLLVHNAWIDGRRVVNAYRSTLIDEDELFAQADAAGSAVLAKANMPVPGQWPVP